MVAGALALTATLALAACSAQTGGMTGSPDTGEGTRSGADAGRGASAYHKITAEEAKALIDEGGVTVVDVRTPKEYADGHVPGALNIPNEDIGSTQPSQLGSTDDKLIVYCRTGVRSKQASDKLVALGFTEVNDMGGIVDWPYGTVAGSTPDGA
ncbi:rhodanese-like domain-containing protein [Gordonibacter sp. RACS_AR68]|nr:rhodanese-like domain-containing protein [Gordonibacter sp. RACS_AR68]